MTDYPIWNWQQKDWPNFTYKLDALKPLEDRFLLESGAFLGTLKFVNKEDRLALTIDLVSEEAVSSSAIEGEILDRASVQSSICRHFDLKTKRVPSKPSEEGIAAMRTSLYHTFTEPLSHETLFEWHKNIMRGHTDTEDIGTYRKTKKPMQIVSGRRLDKHQVFYEAPPAKILKKEMNAFIKWFNKTHPQGSSPLPALTRAGIAHWYFVCIHPFTDGNGRIARALAEKALAQAIQQPSLLALSHTINTKRKAYYEALEKGNTHNNIHSWLLYFSNIILEAEQYSTQLIEFLLNKTKFYELHKDQLNPRQSKVITKLFQAGPEGFEGGLSAQKYISITKAPRATATRDLQDLVEKGILHKTGEGRWTRYSLKL